MDGWSVALLVVSGYVAVTVLVRLMVRHRNELVERFRRELRSPRASQQVEQADLRQPEKKNKAA